MPLSSTPTVPAQSVRPAVFLAPLGVWWTVLTVGFEFLVRAAEGTPVSVTVGQYDVFAGQVWVLVPLTLLVAPYLFGSVLAK